MTWNRIQFIKKGEKPKYIDYLAVHDCFVTIKKQDNSYDALETEDARKYFLGLEKKAKSKGWSVVLGEL